jgi:hypothetical protein
MRILLWMQLIVSVMLVSINGYLVAFEFQKKERLFQITLCVAAIVLIFSLVGC